MRAALVFATIACGSIAVAAPKPRQGRDAAPAPAAEPAPPPKPAGPDDPAAFALLDKIGKGDKAAVADLDKLAPKVVDGLGTFLGRHHDTEPADRRKVLEAIKAQVPDKAGRFATPERKSAKEEKADDDLDWLGELGKLDAATPGLAEVLADDAAIRALAKTNDIHAAALLFDTAFGDDTMIYRDELGRYLRKMEPYSIPALMQESQAKNYDRKRYATYQLERLDRQEPFKALAAATGDEALSIAILQVFEATHHREAVHAVWSKVNADSARVRAAARHAWIAYITGPPPPPAPRKKLQLPGGKLTKKEKPLWLTYRELADNELRKSANELLGEDLPLADPTLDDNEREKKSVKVDLEELTNRLFAFYDEQRTKQEGAQWTAAKALADKGDLANATMQLDRMLAANPDRGEPAARRDGERLLPVGQAARGRVEVGRGRGRVLEGTGPRSEGSTRDRSARGAPLHARQGARETGQGRRPRFPARGRAASRLRVGAGRGRSRGSRGSTGVVALRGGLGRARRTRLVRGGHGKTQGVSAGRLIVIEGLDGAGTTTQARRLVDHLNANGRVAHLTREPSDGPVGRLIREMLTGGHAIEDASLSQGTFGLLFAADRLDHLQREVEPALAAGSIVVSDRWYHSSLAYQGTGADRDWIAMLNARARRPDLTMFLKVRPEVAAKRRADAKRREELFEDLRMQQEVDAGYTATIAELRTAGERIEVLDGELSEDAVFAAILTLV